MLETLDRTAPEVTLVSRSHEAFEIDCDSRQSFLGLAIWFSKTERPTGAALLHPCASGTSTFNAGGEAYIRTSFPLSSSWIPFGIRCRQRLLAAELLPRRAAAHRGRADLDPPINGVNSAVLRRLPPGGVWPGPPGRGGSARRS